MSPSQQKSKKNQRETKTMSIRGAVHVFHKISATRKNQSPTNNQKLESQFGVYLFTSSRVKLFINKTTLSQGSHHYRFLVGCQCFDLQACTHAHTFIHAQNTQNEKSKQQIIIYIVLKFLQLTLLLSRKLILKDSQL